MENNDRERSIELSPNKVAKYTGAAFLFVIVVSLISGVVLSLPELSGGIAPILEKISQHEALMQLSVIFGLMNGAGIVVLAVLLYTLLKKQRPVLALVALGWWLIEAITYVVAQLGALALIPLSREFIAAGSPANSYYQTLGTLLYNGIDQRAATFHMLFYCFGGLIWYSLFYRSRSIPRWIPLFGVLAVCVGLVGVVAEILGHTVPIIVFIPLLPFELSIGLWLLIKGVKTVTSSGRAGNA